MNNEIKTLFKFLNDSLELFHEDYVKLLNCYAENPNLTTTELKQILFYTKIQYALFRTYKEYDNIDYNLDGVEELMLYLLNAIKENE